MEICTVLLLPNSASIRHYSKADSKARIAFFHGEHKEQAVKICQSTKICATMKMSGCSQNPFWKKSVSLYQLTKSQHQSTRELSRKQP